MYQKYANSMPLYWQEQDWRQMGVSLSRATLANWIIYCAGNYFSPLYDYFHRELLKRQFLMADETRIQVLKEPERKAEIDSYMWLFRSGEDGLPAILHYKYTETRARFNAMEFLAGFRGYLETDCYQRYDNLPDIRRCCYWAHLRRYFVEAVPRGKELDYSNLAAQAVQYCNKLFDYERQSHERGHTFEQRKEYRLQKEKPVLDAFWTWISEQAPKKGTRLEKAVNYAQNSWLPGIRKSLPAAPVQCNKGANIWQNVSRVKYSQFLVYYTGIARFLISVTLLSGYVRMKNLRNKLNIMG